MRLIDEVKGFGFLNGKIKFGEYFYCVRLITVGEHEEYVNLVNNKKELEAFHFVIKKCLYREEEITTYKKRNFISWLLKKPKQILKTEIIKIHDFDIKKYPHILCDKFIRDFFKITLDKDFFEILLREGVEQGR